MWIASRSGPEDSLGQLCICFLPSFSLGLGLASGCGPSLASCLFLYMIFYWNAACTFVYGCFVLWYNWDYGMQSQKYLFGLDPCTSWMEVSERGRTIRWGAWGSGCMQRITSKWLNLFWSINLQKYCYCGLYLFLLQHLGFRTQSPFLFSSRKPTENT